MNPSNSSHRALSHVSPNHWYGGHVKGGNDDGRYSLDGWERYQRGMLASQVNTVPQGVIDMNKCTEVFPAENITGHQYSVGIKTPNSTTYFKGTSKEESNRWHDVLVMYPRSIKTKHRRSPTYPTAVKTPEPTSPPPTSPTGGSDSSANSRGAASASSSRTYSQRTTDVNAAARNNRRHTSYVPRDWDKDDKPPNNGYLGLDFNQRKDSTGSGSSQSSSNSRKKGRLSEPTLPREPVPQTYRGVRSLKHKNDSRHNESMRKSSSMHDLTSGEGDDQEGRHRSRTRDSYSSVPRRRSDSAPRSGSTTSAQRALFSDTGRSSPDRHRERSQERSYECLSPPGTFLYNGKNKNETDEHKMAKSASARSLAESPAKINSESHTPSSRSEPYDDLMYMKKGWLLKQDETSKEWHKHWFVLSGTSLKFYEDSRAEDHDEAEGVVEITACHVIQEIEVSRNYGFMLKTKDSDYVLSAMTSGIRSNWIQALQKCMEMSSPGSRDKRGSRSSSPERRPSTGSRSSISSDVSSRNGHVNGAHINSMDTTPWRRISSSNLSSPVRTPGERSRRSSNDSTSTSASDSRYSGQSDIRSSRRGTDTEDEGRGREGRRPSCTWPYERNAEENDLDTSTASSESSAGIERRISRSRSKSVEASRAPHSEKEESGRRRSTYLEDGDLAKKAERSPEEERALDEVEHNIRRIHRKSITEYVQQHKPQHFDKFESGSAFKSDSKSKTDKTAPYSPRSRASSDRYSSYSPKSDAITPTRSHSTSSVNTTPSSTPRRKHSADIPDRKSSSPRAPSAKIKDKSRTKSPRAKSPPPVYDDSSEAFFDGLTTPNKNNSSPDDIIERKWREVEKIGRKGGDTNSATDNSSLGSGERAVVELLETEVESLREQLERSQGEVMELQQTTSDLKAQLRATRREHHDSMNDMEGDQSRFMGQIEDMQTEMEHATGYLSSRLAEHESLSEQAQHQVSSLQSQLKASQEALRKREQEMELIRSKLAEAESELEHADSILSQSSKELRSEKECLEAKCEELEGRVSSLADEVMQLERDAEKREHIVAQKEVEMTALREGVERQTAEVAASERTMKELMTVRGELQEKVSLVKRLEAQLASTHEQLNETDHRQEERTEALRQRLRETEAQLSTEKGELQRQLGELQAQLDSASKQARMADNLNSSMADILREKDETIAQLEERLIESDSRMEELRTRLKEEEDSLSRLHDSVDHSTEEKLTAQRELELARAVLAEHEATLVQLREDLEEERHARSQHQREVSRLRHDVERGESELQAMADRAAGLQELLDNYAASGTEDAKHEWKEMEARLNDFSDRNHDLARKCADLSRELAGVREQNAALEDQLSHQRQELEAQLQTRGEELSLAQTRVTQLQAQLTSAEKSAAQSKQQLESKAGDTSEAASEQLKELQEKYEAQVKQTRRLREQLREAQTSSDDLEMTCQQLQQRWTTLEEDYKQQIAMMGERVQDLTNKLANAEKKARRMEKRLQRRESKSRKRDSDLAMGEGGDAPVEKPVEAIVAAETATCQSVPAVQVPESASDSDCGVVEGDAVGRIRVLQVELQESQSQLQRLSEQLSAQTSLQQQLEEAKGSQHTLTQQNEALKQEISELQTQLASGAGLTTSHQQLHSLAQELEDAVVPTQESYTMIIAGLQARLCAIAGKPADTQPASNESQRLRAVVERFSLEAAAVKELVQLSQPSRGGPRDAMETQLMALQHAHARTLALQLRLERHQGATGRKDDATVTYSRLLSERLVLQGKLRLLLEQYQREGNVEAADMEEQEAALHAHACMLAARAMVQGELVHVMAYLRSHVTQGLTASQRQDILARELASAQAQLHARQSQVSSLLTAYRQQHLHQFAATLLAQSSGKRHTYSNLEDLKAALSTHLLRTAESLRTELESIGMDINKNSAIIDGDVQQCLDSVLKTLDDIYEAQSKSESSSTDQAGSLSSDMVNRFAQVLAEEVVVRTFTLLLLKQVEVGESVDSWEENTHSRLSRHDSGMSSMPTSPLPVTPLPAINDADVDSIPERLAQDAHTLRHLAAHSTNHDLDPNTSTLKGQLVRTASDLITLDGELVHHAPVLTSHAAMVTRELMHTAQLELVISSLKMQHEQQLDALQDKMEELRGSAQERVALEAEVAQLNNMLAENEEKIQNEQDSLEESLQQLRAELSTQEATHKSEMELQESRSQAEVQALQEDLQDMEDELDRVERDRDEEVAQLKDKITSLESKLEKASKDGHQSDSDDIVQLRAQLEASQEKVADVERRHGEEVARLRAQITSLETELGGLKEKHQGVLDQAQADLRMAVQAVSAQEADKLETEVEKLRNKLDAERARHVAELQKLRNELGADAGGTTQALLNSKVAELELQLANLQMDYEQELAVQRAAHRRELARSKDDMLQLLSAAELANTKIDEDVIRKKYTKDMDHIRDIYDRGFSAMERSHQKVLMEMRRTHKHELDLLRHEKDQLLAEETQATQAALDAMRKAHEAELQKERGKFLDVIAKTYSHNDVESLQKQHEEDLELIQNEIKNLSEQYSIKCIESATLEDRHEAQTRILNDCRRRITDLMTRNEELNLLVKHEIERLTRLVRQAPPPPGQSPMRKEGEAPEVYDMRAVYLPECVALRLKEVEVSQLRNELDTIKEQLGEKSQELDESREKCSNLHSENTVSKLQLEQEIAELKRRLAEVTETDDGSGEESVYDDDAIEERPDSSASERTRSRSHSPAESAVNKKPMRRSESDAPLPLRSSRVSGQRLPLKKASSVLVESAVGKRSSWRQRNPERARSSPGLSAATQLSLLEQINEKTASPERPRRNTDFGVQEKF